RRGRRRRANEDRPAPQKVQRHLVRFSFEFPRDEVIREALAGTSDRNLSERAGSQSLRQSETSRRSERQRRHAQPSSAETDDNLETDTRLAQRTRRLNSPRRRAVETTVRRLMTPAPGRD